ncbi:uncharacterized protein LOC124401684 [Silurus meridionalis]|uniref:Ig-like domain-containing protein n=1 Tax=Silurus meridionalis TaxID=175797 RepID=A0A8T0ANG4_SILME|nr:uncharacterized protein LOC124401684 [Silurus meridionalis]KAF7694459.1 hypothetical protein HF521_008212 [Silurus meridionalis]
MLLGFSLLLVMLPVTKGCNLNNNKKIFNISAHVGDTVLLPCSCTDPQSQSQKVTWKKNHKLNSNWVYVPTLEIRFQLSNVQNGNLSLLISHLTAEDDGLYRCSTSQDLFTDINLSVKGEPVSAEPSIFMILIPVVLLLLSLGGVILWRYRARKQLTPNCKELAGQKNEEEAQRKKQEMQDDVMYTTVVYTTQIPKLVSTKEST